MVVGYCRIVGLSDCRIIRLSDCRALSGIVGFMTDYIDGLTDQGSDVATCRAASCDVTQRRK
eukprot:1194949-Prymnesium_polylepis.1